LRVTSLFVTHDQVEAMTLGQRLIVMNAGHMEQIGTPETVYAQPATTFVAGFIGSPPMNLLRGRADGMTFSVDGATLPLPSAAPRSGEAMLGLRPEHTELRAGSPGWPLQVDMIEMLGAERLVHGRVGTLPFTVRQDSTLPTPQPGDTVPLHASSEHLHWFDAATQRRL
jgi:sn-glycerol 3-phosphate transport system ATP-binding protein